MEVENETADAVPDLTAWFDFTATAAMLDGVSSIAMDTTCFQVAVIIHQVDNLKAGVPTDAIAFTSSRESLLERFDGVDLFLTYGVDVIASLRGLFVSKEYRRQGIATRLRTRCPELVQSKNIPLVAGHSNASAREIFEKMDFEVVTVDSKGNSIEVNPNRIPFVKRC